MQLRGGRWWPGALAGLLALGAAGGARAEVEASSHLLLFTEPSENGQGVRVIHPQTDVAASTAGLSLRAGYELDIVSGASPRVYSSAEAGGPDAVSGATFSDVRHAARMAAGFETATVALQAGYSYGWENDYRSHTVSVSARGDFLERNFSLSLAYTGNFDRVCDQANAFAQGPLERQPLGTSDECFTPGSVVTADRQLRIDTFEPALSWTATPLLLLQAGVTLQIQDGFQSNPYRAVRVGNQGREPQEQVPDHRQRYALFARANQAIPLLRSAVRVGGRVYRDTWDVQAATADGEWLQYLGPNLIAGVRGRYHKQGRAIFFRTPIQYRTLGPVGSYFTGDRELAPLTNVLAGVKLTFVKTAPPGQDAILDELEVGVRYDILFYRGADDTPNADRNLAHIMQAGFSLHF